MRFIFDHDFKQRKFFQTTAFKFHVKSDFFQHVELERSVFIFKIVFVLLIIFWFKSWKNVFYSFFMFKFFWIWSIHRQRFRFFIKLEWIWHWIINREPDFFSLTYKSSKLNSCISRKSFLNKIHSTWKWLKWNVRKKISRKILSAVKIETNRCRIDKQKNKKNLKKDLDKMLNQNHDLTVNNLNALKNWHAKTLDDLNFLNKKLKISHQKFRISINELKILNQKLTILNQKLTISKQKLMISKQKLKVLN